jgi:hypothetical protein
MVRRDRERGGEQMFKGKKGKFKTNQNAALVLGQPNFTNHTCAVTQTNLQNPRGIGFGP